MEMKVLLFLSSLSSLSIHSSLLLNQQVHQKPLLSSINRESLLQYQQEFCLQYHLNDSQQQIFQKVCELLLSSQYSPFLLIQGVFGSGKSYTIAILLLFLYSLQTISQSQLAVLFCSHTNTAVDRVCRLLKEFEFKNFRRFGNIRKIHPEIRSFYGNKKEIGNNENYIITSTLCSLSEMIDSMDIIIIDESSQVTEYYVYCIINFLMILGFITMFINESKTSNLNW